MVPEPLFTVSNFALSSFQHFGSAGDLQPESCGGHTGYAPGLFSPFPMQVRLRKTVAAYSSGSSVIECFG